MNSRKSEIEAVKNLGGEIGYGNMMDIASALWAMSLQEKYKLDSGAFVPTIVQFMLPEERGRALKQQATRIAEIKEQDARK